MVQNVQSSVCCCCCCCCGGGVSQLILITHLLCWVFKTTYLFSSFFLFLAFKSINKQTNTLSRFISSSFCTFSKWTRVCCCCYLVYFYWTFYCFLNGVLINVSKIFLNNSISILKSSALFETSPIQVFRIRDANYFIDIKIDLDFISIFSLTITIKSMVFVHNKKLFGEKSEQLKLFQRSNDFHISNFLHQKNQRCFKTYYFSLSIHFFQQTKHNCFP